MTLPWLEQYAGQTTEELLALEREFRTDSLAVALESALQEKAARVGTPQLTREERYVLALESYEREVNNGGHAQFLSNPSKAHLPHILEALEAARCPLAADLVREALGVLQLPTPFSDEDVDAALERLKPEQVAVLDALDQRYYAEVGDLAPNVLELARRNLQQIRIP